MTAVFSVIYHQGLLSIAMQCNAIHCNALSVPFKLQFQPEGGPPPCAKPAPYLGAKYLWVL